LKRKHLFDYWLQVRKGDAKNTIGCNHCMPLEIRLIPEQWVVLNGALPRVAPRGDCAQHPIEKLRASIEAPAATAAHLRTNCHAFLLSISLSLR